MATPTERLPGNVAGAFYVDASCIDCDQCRAMAPQFFARNDGDGLSIVIRQPETEEEVALVREAMSSCATSSIGDDGA
jgi:ferredoxin